MTLRGHLPLPVLGTQPKFLEEAIHGLAIPRHFRVQAMFVDDVVQLAPPARTHLSLNQVLCVFMVKGRQPVNTAGPTRAMIEMGDG